MQPHTIILICPICGNSLHHNEKYFSCQNNHCFDIARQGYVNLLLPNQKKSLQPGDNKEMVKSRIDFLNRGFYFPIVEKLTEVIQQISPQNMVDVGCGVGYYLTHVKNGLPQASTCWGLDISKEAIHAASQYKNVNWLVGSAKSLPFATQSVDMLLSVFSPFYLEEIKRVLKSHGHLITLTPGSNHLLSLREFLFDEVKDIDSEKVLQKTTTDFALLETHPIHFTVQLKSNTDIMNLVKMTPFYWRINADKKADLETLDVLEVTIEVILRTLAPIRKNK